MGGSVWQHHLLTAAPDWLVPGLVATGAAAAYADSTLPDCAQHLLQSMLTMLDYAEGAMQIP